MSDVLSSTATARSSGWHMHISEDTHLHGMKPAQGNEALAPAGEQEAAIRGDDHGFEPLIPLS